MGALRTLEMERVDLNWLIKKGRLEIKNSRKTKN